MLLPEIFIAEPRETSHSSFCLHHSTFRHPSLPPRPPHSPTPVPVLTVSGAAVAKANFCRQT